MISVRQRPAELQLRELTGEGRLAGAAAEATPAEHAALVGAAYSVVWPLVFARITRPLERRRGHWTCATGPRRLADACLDGFHDDLEAVVTDLLTNARTPIANLEAWVSARLTAATVNGHRRRRGSLGALQRPRIPGWLAVALDHDPVLTDLAVQILIWVGVRHTAGAQLWPLDSWAYRHATDPTAVGRSVHRVLAAMRTRPRWYLAYVELPLGHKITPVVALVGGASEPPPLVLDAAELAEARLAELASVAVDAIAVALRRGEPAREAVRRVLEAIFNAGTGADDLDRVPGTGPTSDEQVAALLADAAMLDRITAAAVLIVADLG